VQRKLASNESTRKSKFCKLCQKNEFDFSDTTELNDEEIICLTPTTQMNNPKVRIIEKISKLFKNKDKKTPLDRGVLVAISFSLHL